MPRGARGTYPTILGVLATHAGVHAAGSATYARLTDGNVLMTDADPAKAKFTACQPMKGETVAVVESQSNVAGMTGANASRVVVVEANAKARKAGSVHRASKRRQRRARSESRSSLTEALVKSLAETLAIWGIVIVSVGMGVAWLRSRKRMFMAWPAFTLAGMTIGIALQNQAISNWSFGLGAVAVAAQIIFDGLHRGR
jgi:hypothetical protein